MVLTRCAETPSKLLAKPAATAPPHSPPAALAADAAAPAAAAPSAATPAAPAAAAGSSKKPAARVPSELGTLLEQKRMRKAPLEGSSQRHSRFSGAFQVRSDYGTPIPNPNPNPSPSPNPNPNRCAPTTARSTSSRT